jgi:hypothetical protein
MRQKVPTPNAVRLARAGCPTTIGCSSARRMPASNEAVLTLRRCKAIFAGKAHLRLSKGQEHLVGARMLRWMRCNGLKVTRSSRCLRLPIWPRICRRRGAQAFQLTRGVTLGRARVGTTSLTPREREVLHGWRKASPRGRSAKFSISPSEPSTNTFRPPFENCGLSTGLMRSQSPFETTSLKCEPP